MFKTKIELNDRINNHNLFLSIFELFAIFDRNKAEIYLVGGCVRDMLLGREPKDYDFCTNLTPEQVKELIIKENIKQDRSVDCYSIIETGLKHGTITIHDKLRDFFFEITTYRVDGKYTDGRHPDNVTFTPSLEEDLKRRDFTINSFAYNLLKSELVMLDESYLRDLELGIIRTVGKAEERYNEDALRMLRALRFSAQLNFSISKNTYEAIKNCNSLITKVSKERIRDELTKIVMSDHPEALELVCVTDLEKYLFDGLTPFTDVLNCEHQNPWHYTDVFHHTMDVIKKVPKTFELRWAAAFHDLGKPAVKELKEGTTNHYHYHGHEDTSADISLKLMEILKFSNDQKDLIYKFVKYHDTSLSEVKNSTFKKVVNNIGKENFKDFMRLRFADAYSHKLSQSTKYVIDAIDKVYERFNKLCENDDALTVADLDINGYDLMEQGLQGKQIGEYLNFCLELVLEEPSLNKKEVLLRFIDTFKNSEKGVE